MVAYTGTDLTAQTSSLGWLKIRSSSLQPGPTLSTVIKHPGDPLSLEFLGESCGVSEERAAVGQGGPSC